MSHSVDPDSGDTHDSTVRHDDVGRESIEWHKQQNSVFYSLTDNLPLFVILKDLEGCITFVNRRVAKLLGRTPDEIVGKTDFDLFPRELAEKYRADDRRVIESGKEFEDVEENRSDAEMQFVEVRKSPIRNTQGEVIGVQVIFWDVTDRRNAEQQLRQEQNLLHSLLDNVPDTIYFKDVDSRFLRVSRSLAEKFGHGDHANVLGKTDQDLFTDLHALEAREDELRVMQTGEPILGKLEKETWHSGKVTWVSSTKLPLRDKTNKIVGTFGITRDLTELKAAQEGMARERDLLRTLMDHLPDYVFIKDVDGRFVTVNKPFLDSLDIADVEEVVGKTDYDLVSEELARQFDTVDRKVIEEGVSVVELEQTHRNRFGKEVWLSTTKVPLRGPYGKVTGLVGICRDITTRKMAERQLQTAKEAADAANRAKGHFLANMSHEIRTPLNGIIGMTELLLETVVSPVQLDYLRMIQQSGEALLTVINDILDFSKIEAGKLELEELPFNLREGLGDVMKSIAQRAHEKQLELAFAVAPAVPEVLIGDMGRLRQVILNLTSNAIKFTDVGEVVVEVKCLSQTLDEVELGFKVTDTGVGIPADKRDSIFREFEQADTTTTRRHGGTGLGLAISRRLVELMEGKIWLEQDQLGSGSTFHFTSRFAIERNPRPSIQQDPTMVSDTPVLVVDDNATNRRILRDMLRNWGMDPTCVEGAAAAQKALKTARTGGAFHLVITDVHMPDVDGHALAEWIHNEPELDNTPVIVLTSGADAPGRIAPCITSRLVKPAKQSELFNAIVAALGQRSARAGDWQPVQTGGAAESDLNPVCRSLRILLAEDNIVNQRLATGLLEAHGHSVTVAGDGRTAIQYAQGDEFDVVLMDLQMPDIDGLTATESIRRNEGQSGRHIPIIAMTAHAMKGDRERCLAAGMDEYIAKPIRVKVVLAVLAKVCGKSVETETTESQDAPSEVQRDGCIDWSTVLRSVYNSRKMLAEIALIFLEECPQTLANLRRYAEDNDVPNVGKSVHSLISALSFVGETDALSLARAILQSVHDDSLSDPLPKVRMLQGEVEKIIDAVKDYLPEVTTDN